MRLTRACRAMAGLVDGDDSHSAPAVKRSCLGVSWWLGAGADERRGQVVAWSVGATSRSGVSVAFAVRALACACASLARLGVARSGHCGARNRRGSCLA